MRLQCADFPTIISFAKQKESHTELFTYQDIVNERVYSLLLRNREALINQQRAQLVRESSVALFPKVGVLTLVILGREDKDFSEPT